MGDIDRGEKKKQFNFEYLGRLFEFSAKTEEETNIWVICLQFLRSQKKAEEESNKLKRGVKQGLYLDEETLRARMYFNSLPTFNTIVDDQRTPELGGPIVFDPEEQK